MNVAESANRYHHGDLKRALQEATVEIVEKHGPQAVTLRAVALLAGVSRAAPYRHYADKEALLAAVAEQGFREFTAELHAARERHVDPVDALRAQGVAYVDYAQRRSSQFRLMFGPYVNKERHPGLIQESTAALAELTSAVEECQQAGLLRSGSLEEAALATWSIAHGLASLLLENPHISRHPDQVERIIDSVFTGLERGPGAAR